MNVVILSSSHSCYATLQIKKAGEARGHNMLVLDPAKLYLFVSDKESGYDRLYDGYNSKVDRIIAKDIDAVIPRIAKSIEFATAIIEHFNKNVGIYTTQSADGIRIASDKIKTLQRCSSANIRTPKTIFVNNAQHIDFCIEKLGALPVVVKLLSGSKGVGVSVLETDLTAYTTLQTYFKSGSKVLLQEYIDSNCEDIRAVVVGNKVVAAYKRKAPKKDFRANMSLGGSGEAIKLSLEDELFCVRCARATNLEVAGIDIVKDKSGRTYCIEVNSNFGFRIQKITGVNIGEEIIKHIEESKSTVNDSAIVDEYYNSELFLALEEQKKLNGNLAKKLTASEAKQKFFIDNPNIQDIFSKSEGEIVDYINKTGEKKYRKISTINDLYEIMFDSLMIK